MNDFKIVNGTLAHEHLLPVNLLTELQETTLVIIVADVTVVELELNLELDVVDVVDVIDVIDVVDIVDVVELIEDCKILIINDGLFDVNKAVCCIEISAVADV